MSEYQTVNELAFEETKKKMVDRLQKETDDLFAEFTQTKDRLVEAKTKLNVWKALRYEDYKNRN